MPRLFLAACVVLAACGSGRSPTTETPAPTPPPPTTAASLPSTPTTATTVPSRVVIAQAWAAFAVAGDVTLHFPSDRVERVGLHQSNDEGARPIEPLTTEVPVSTLETRDRLSDANSSADVVVDPATEIRAPVTGTVIETGSYDLYCDLDDYFINIEPDDHPGWKVRLLHLTGVAVSEGQRVEAGATLVAPGARQLPFMSDVDELRIVDPAWPHVHIEVSDPTIPNVANPGSGYENC